MYSWLMSSLGDQCFPSKIRNRTGMPALTTSVLNCTGSSGQSKYSRKIKGIQTGKEVKIPLFAEEMILHVGKKPKECTKKLLQAINKLSRIREYKVEETIPFTKG